MRVLLFLLFVTLPLAAVAETRVLVLGDSILAWNTLRGGSIPQQLNRYKGISVRNEAASGAVFSGSKGLFGREITKQFPGGTWDVIVLDGGGNDLMRECGCGRCNAVLDQLVSPDGRSGEIPAFLDALAQRSTRIIWLDYFPTSVRGGPFAPCRDELAVLEQRMKTVARQRGKVTFVDAGAVYDPNDMSLYARDLIHPTPKGGGRIAKLLAQTIVRQD